MRSMKILLATAFLAGSGAAAVAQAQQPDTSSHLGEPLKTYLQGYLSQGGKVPPDTTTRITAVKVPADHGGEEYVVYVSGQRWCGSGGCMLLILGRAESSFKVLGKVTIVRLPIRLLSSMNHGRPDVGVMVQGGGISPGHEAVLSFNGKRYPGNPSVSPVRKTDIVLGKVIIANADGSIPLYD